MNEVFNPMLFRTTRPEAPADFWQPVYDRANLATTLTGDTSFFAIPRGGTATLIRAAVTGSYNKTTRDTNLDNAGMIPSKVFTVYGLSYGLCVATLATNIVTETIDRYLLVYNSYIRFKIIDADILLLPLIAIPCLNPIVALAAPITPTSGSAFFFSDPSGGGPGQAIYTLPVPVTLEAGKNFSFTLSVDGTITTTTTHDMYMFLHAMMRRPGQ